MGLNLSFLSNNKSKFLLVLFSCFIIYQLIGIYNIEANLYTTEWYNSDSLDVKGVTLYSPDISVVQGTTFLTPHIDLTDTSFSATVGYYMPQETLITTALRSFTSNQSCTNFGTVNRSALTYESHVKLTTDATTYLTTLTSGFTLVPSINDVRFLVDKDLKDSSNNMYNAHFYNQMSFAQLDINTQSKFDAYAYGHMVDPSDFSECYSKIRPQSHFNDTQTFANTQTRNWYVTRYVIFNSSSLGDFDFDFDLTGLQFSCTLGGNSLNYGWYRTGYYKLESSPTWQDLGTSTTGSGSVALDPDTMYVFHMSWGGSRYNGAGSDTTCTIIEPPHDDTFTINTYLPNYVCGDYSECVNGSKFRTCIDQNGLSPDKIEYALCYVLPDESINFGFENWTTRNVWYNHIGFACGCFSETKEVLYPSDWYVENPTVRIADASNKEGKLYDFVKMTSETAYEGDKSLKMWNIAPQQFIPDVSTFLGVDNTSIIIVSPINYTNNTGWIDPTFAFNEGSSANTVGTSYITYNNYSINSSFLASDDSLRNFTVDVYTKKDNPSETINYSCVQIYLDGTWSTCQSFPITNTLTHNYLDFTTFAQSYTKEELDTLQIRVTTNGGTGTLRLNWLPIIVEYFDENYIVQNWQSMICGNQTTGIYPDLRNTFDDSVFIERNITLPTPYMSASFKVKKCSTPEFKFTSPNIFGIPICWSLLDYYYTSSQYSEENIKGRISFYLKDSNNNFLTDITSQVTFPNQWESREYAIDSLQTGETYTMGLAVVPDSTADGTTYCIYVDDVNIDIRDQALVCTSECDDETRIERTCKQYVGLTCTICEEVRYYSSECIGSQDVIDKLGTCSDWCGCEDSTIYPVGSDGYDTKFVGNYIDGCNVTNEGNERCCNYNEIEDSQYCVDWCSENVLTDPVSQDLQTAFDEAGVGWAGAFFTAIFIVLMVIVGISVIVSFILDKNPLVFLAVMITGLVIASVLWVEFAFIGIIIAVIMCFLLAGIIKKQASGN